MLYSREYTGQQGIIPLDIELDISIGLHTPNLEVDYIITIWEKKGIKLIYELEKKVIYRMSLLKYFQKQMEQRLQK